MNQKFADDFGGNAINPDKWDVTAVTPGINIGVAGSVLTVNMGTTANAETHFLSKTIFTVPFDLYAVLSFSQRIVGNNVWVEFVEVNPDTGVPVVNPNNAAEWSNRCALAFLTSATAGAAELQVISDASPAATTPVQTTSWTAVTSVHECHLEARGQDLYGFNVGVDTNGARGASLRMSRSMIDPNKAYKLRLRFKNEAVAPASATTISLFRILCNDIQELVAEVSSGRGDSVAGKGIAVNMTGTVSIQGSSSDNAAAVNPVIAGALMTSTAGGLTAGTSGNQGRLVADLSRRLIVQPFGNAQSHLSGRVAALTTTGETSLLAAQGATLRTNLQTVTLVNHDTVSACVDIRDVLTGTIRETIRAAPGATESITFPAGRPSTTQNAAWTVQLRAATTTNGVDINASFFSTTG